MRFHSPFLQPLPPVAEKLGLRLGRSTLRVVALALAALLLVGIVVRLRLLPPTGIGRILYSVHDSLYLPLKGYTYTLHFPTSLLWWLGGALLAGMVLFFWLTNISPTKRPHIWALRRALRYPALQQFLLLVGGLRAMASRQHTAGQILDSYLLRSMAVAGYAPSFDHCTRCGEPGPHRWLNPSAGGVLCSDCRLPGSATPAAETIAVLGALLAGDWPAVEAAEPRHLKEASGVVAAYVAWHLERGLRSLAYVER